MPNVSAQSGSPALNRVYSGAAPPIIEKVISRKEIALDHDIYYAEWATEFAVLSDAYVAHVRKCKPPESVGDMFERGWKPNAGMHNCYYRYRRNVGLWVGLCEAGGWSIELTNEGCDEHARILTVVQGDMPALCSTLPLALDLAESSFPDVHYLLYWRRYY